MNKEFRLRQGNSYVFVGELRDDNGNVLQLSDYDKITLLIISPSIYKVVVREKDYRIEDNKLLFELSAMQTRLFKSFVSIEAELRQGDTVIVGKYEKNIPVEHNNISKL